MGLRDLAPDRRILNNHAETVHLRTREPAAALRDLHDRGRQHVWLEGGPTLAAAFLTAGLVDEVVAYVAPSLLGAGASTVGDLGITTISDQLRFRIRQAAVIGTGRRRQRPTDPREDPLMFTGIVEELGTVAAIEEQGDALRLSISAQTVLEGTGLGDSISVNGCCLTVTDVTDGTWTADVMAETLDKTSLAGARPGDRVNLERAVTPQTRLGGHIVQGHVDGVGEVLRRTPSEHWEVVEVSLPPHLAPYLVDKGSITVDGVSLTVVEAGDESFTVSLIPETLARTTLGSRAVGDRVNLEADIIAKHVEKLLQSGVHTRKQD